MSGMTSSLQDLQQERSDLKFQLKKFEDAFVKDEGRNPTRDDKRANPAWKATDKRYSEVGRALKARETINRAMGHTPERVTDRSDIGTDRESVKTDRKPKKSRAGAGGSKPAKELETVKVNFGDDGTNSTAPPSRKESFATEIETSRTSTAITAKPAKSESVLAKISEDRADQLRAIFYYCDVDRDGSVTIAELRKTLTVALGQESVVDNYLDPLNLPEDQELDQELFFQIFMAGTQDDKALESLLRSKGQEASREIFVTDKNTPEAMLLTTLQERVTDTLTGFDWFGLFSYLFLFGTAGFSFPMLWYRHYKMRKSNRLMLFLSATVSKSTSPSIALTWIMVGVFMYGLAWMPIVIWCTMKSPMVAVQEALMPPVYFSVTSIIIAVILSSGEGSSFASRGSSLENFLKLNKVYSIDIGIETTSDLVRVMARRMDRWARDHRWQQRLLHMVGCVLVLPGALVPIVVRVQFKGWGALFGGGQPHEVVLAVNYFVMAIVWGIIVLSLLSGVIWSFLVRLARLRLVTALTDKHKGRMYGVPYLEFDNDANTISWALIRDHFQTKGALHLRWMELVVGTTLFCVWFVMAVGVAMHQFDLDLTRINPDENSDKLDNRVFKNLAIYFVCVFGTYLMVILVLGFTYNELFHTAHMELLIRKRFELGCKLCGAEGELREGLMRAQQTMSVILPMIEFSDVTFKLFGVRVRGEFVKVFIVFAIIGFSYGLANYFSSRKEYN